VTASIPCRRTADTIVLPQPTECPGSRRLFTPPTRCTLGKSLIYLTLSLRCPTRWLPFEKMGEGWRWLRLAGVLQHGQPLGTFCTRIPQPSWPVSKPRCRFSGVTTADKLSLSRQAM
jgi:hypothetical protein